MSTTMICHHARVPLEITGVPEGPDFIAKKRFPVIKVLWVEIASKSAA